MISVLYSLLLYILSASFFESFEGFRLHFLSNVGGITEVAFDTFPDFWTNGALHDSIVNSPQVDSRAHGKTTYKPLKLKKKRQENKDEQLTHLLLI